MRTLAIATQKGGSGKTTLAVHLAVAAQHAGRRVLVIDADPQGSALAWAQARDHEEPLVEGLEPSRVPARIDRAKRDGVDLVIVDTAPRASTSLAAVLRAADFVIVPLRPSAFDLATLGQSLALVTAAGRPGAIVLNACPARAPEIAETRDETQKLALPRAPIEIAERRVYGRAVASGRAVVEFEPSGAAAAEIAELWNYVSKRMR